MQIHNSKTIYVKCSSKQFPDDFCSRLGILFCLDIMDAVDSLLIYMDSMDYFSERQEIKPLQKLLTDVLLHLYILYLLLGVVVSPLAHYIFVCDSGFSS